MCSFCLFEVKTKIMEHDQKFVPKFHINLYKGYCRSGNLCRESRDSGAFALYVESLETRELAHCVSRVSRLGSWRTVCRESRDSGAGTLCVENLETRELAHCVSRVSRLGSSSEMMPNDDFFSS